MAEQSNLLQVFENILTSQSFELLHHFSKDESWVSLSQEEKELLAQLFLLSAEASSRTGETDEIRKRAIQAYRTACRLAPGSARNWYRLGAYLALGEQETDLTEAIAALKQAVHVDSGFFDAHYAMGCARLRLGALKGEDLELIEADLSFAQADKLVSTPEGSSAPAEFYWHWGIIWFLRSRSSGEPVELKKCLEYFELARLKGLSTPTFFNDFGNATVEMALLTSNDPIIHDAISLYLAAIESSSGSADESHEKAVRLFNVGCCYQHLFDLSRDSHHFESAEQVFSQAAALNPSLPAVWQRWGLLLFQSFRFRPSSQIAQEVLKKLKTAEERGAANAITFALCSQALQWLGRDQEDFTVLSEAEQYAARAMKAEEGLTGHHPEVWAANILCQYEYGYYFQDRTRFAKALNMLQEALAEHPKSALLWHLLGLLKVAEAEMTDSEKTLRESLVSYHLASRSTYANTPAFWNDWGIALLSLADLTEDPGIAQEALSKLLTAHEMVPDALAPWTYNLARAYDLLGEILEDEACYEEAIFTLDEILTQDPNCTYARQQLALSYLHHGELEEETSPIFKASVEAFEAYLQAEPEDEYSWGDYGLALIYLGLQEKVSEALPKEWFQAEEALIRSLSLGNDQACYYLASLYSLMGNFAEAIQFLESALKRDLLPPVEVIREDPWFEPLAKTVAFNDFATRVLTLHRDEDQISPDSEDSDDESSYENT
jgi:tetratricopeptide (TPR) repeat protein